MKKYAKELIDVILFWLYTVFSLTVFTGVAYWLHCIWPAKGEGEFLHSVMACVVAVSGVTGVVCLIRFAISLMVLSHKIGDAAP